MSPNKRKRSDSDASATVTISESNTPVLSDVIIHSLPDEQSQAKESPRSKVAAKFQGLELRTTASPSPIPQVVTGRVGNSGRRNAKERGRKRVRIGASGATQLEGSFGAEDSGLLGLGLSTPVQSTVEVIGALDAAEIGETPGCYTRFPSSPPISPGQPQTKGMTGSDTTQKASKRRIMSPPPPTPAMSPEPLDGMEDAISPIQLKQTLNSNNHVVATIESAPDALESLTWQDSEITGQEIDTLLGDDGEGINGLGFKPTPAMQHARSLKRKQQVNDWRAREAREARQKRIEKRRGGSSGKIDFAGQKRSVRFADLD